jgi:hypothetical protein
LKRTDSPERKEKQELYGIHNDNDNRMDKYMTE